VTYDFRKWVENERRSIPRNRIVPYALGVVMIATAALAMFEVFEQDDRGKVANLGLPLILLALAMIASPFGREGWAGFGNGRYDEFERAVLTRATFHAFSLLLALILFFFLWLWISSSNGWPVPSTPLDWSALGFAFLGIGAALPVLMAELMVPMPPHEDAKEEAS
jgi:hypothetical protein